MRRNSFHPTRTSVEPRLCGASPFYRRLALVILLLASVSIFVPRSLLADDLSVGAKLYAEHCAVCHGEQGEGVEGIYGDPLIGDRSIGELAKIIHDTMPEGSPEEIEGKDAAEVATYVHRTFYSKAARADSEPGRIELSRLTVRQYETSLADLIGSFRSEWEARKYWDQKLAEIRADKSFHAAIAPKPQPDDSDKKKERRDRNEGDDAHGLKAAYFKSRVVGFRDRVFGRTDRMVDFDFGKGSPHPLLSHEEFAMSWDGSIIAPETGDYELVVESSNGVRLFVNDMQEPLIDAVVRSGDETEFKNTIRLLGGRIYPLRLEYHRSKRDETAHVALKWRRPGRVTEVIPNRLLLPYRSPEVYVVTTPFPPDDRSTGYVRGTSISKEWDEATTFAALETAAYVVKNIDELAGTKPDAEDRTEKLKQFCATFAERAFRRPLDDEFKQVLIDKQFDEAPDTGTAVKRSVLLTLKSPRFLYHESITPESDDFAIASRLSFGLWDSIPDKALREAAAAGKLSDEPDVRKHAERMVNDPRAYAKLREFMHSWLNLDRMHDMAKDEKQFPGFDSALAADLQSSLDLFLDDRLWSESADFRELLTADTQFLNGRLADFYGVDLPSEAGFRPIEFESDVRAGILTHPLMMSGFAYFETSSPIHRGVFVARSVLGRTLRPPPEAVAPEAPELHPDLTTRERVHLQTSPPNCATCHSMINPLGFSFENFDAAGRFRASERDQPIDTTGEYTTSEGDTVPLGSATILAEYLATSAETHAAFTEQMFRHVTKNPIQVYGQDRQHHLIREFERDEFNVRDLMVESVLVAATPVSPPEETQVSAREPAKSENE